MLTNPRHSSLARTVIGVYSVTDSAKSTTFPIQGRLVFYLLFCLCMGAFATLANATQPGDWIAFAVHRFGVAAWTAQVLFLVAVLTLAVPSRIVAFQLALLAALVQGYLFMALVALWSTSPTQHWDRQMNLVVLLGLSATLGAVLWLVVRIVGKRTLGADAAVEQGRSGQFGIRELLYVMASVSVVLAFVSLFSFAPIIPADQLLLQTITFAVMVGPAAYGPFWIVVMTDWRQWQRIWGLLAVVLWMGMMVWVESRPPWRPMYYTAADLAGTVAGYLGTAALNGIALWLLGLRIWSGANELAGEDRTQRAASPIT